MILDLGRIKFLSPNIKIPNCPFDYPNIDVYLNKILKDILPLIEIKNQIYSKNTSNKPTKPARGMERPV